MKILVFTGMGEPDSSTNKCMIRSLKKLGVEVVTAGPPYWDRGYDADIPLPDRPHPELYTYKEVLSRAPWTPDWIVQIEPHAYLIGKKPDGIRSAFWFTDPHRGGATYQALAREGSFDLLFNVQKHFNPLFESIAPTEWLPTAFDPERFNRHPGDPVCDIVFVGQTGIGKLVYDQQDELGRYATKAPEKFTMDRFEFNQHPGFDYAERAEMLIRLSDDFKVRFYEPFHDNRYGAALQKGAIGFNRSLLKDIGTRTFEILASGRLLVTDEVPYLNELMIPYVDGVDPARAHCVTYRTYYKPFFDNFRIEYEFVRDRIRLFLQDDYKRVNIAKAGQDMVWATHTFRNRASQLLQALHLADGESL